MTQIRIDLQEGFRHDAVTIRVNGEEVLNTDVSTRLQTGFAGSVEIDVPEPSATIEIALPDRDVSATIPLHVDSAVYVGVSLTPDSKIEHRLSQDPFGYV